MKKIIKKLKKFKTDIKKVISSFVWFSKLLFKIAPVSSILVVFIDVLLSVIPLANTYIYSLILDEIIALATSDLTSLSQLFSQFAEYKKFLFLLSLTLALLSSISLLNIIRRQIQSRFWAIILPTIRDKLTEKIASVDIQQRDSPKIADLIRKAEDKFSEFPAFYIFLNNFIKASVNLHRTKSMGYS